MENNLFQGFKISQGNQKWKNSVLRQQTLYARQDDIRSEFSRDYNRILHSTAYRRLKHKTQVFFATRNDHVCTRIEHVNHVTAISYTIAKYLGLNTELTNAIALGHDIGHAPFGHAGELYLSKITNEELKYKFWHEKNSLRFVDYCETLEDPDGSQQNLNLTYAVRDGIICHCGEIDENGIKPREDFFDLYDIKSPGIVEPYSWEGCVVKICDKIAYLGRDIQDAITLNILEEDQLQELKKIIFPKHNGDHKEINNTVLIHDFIIDLCSNSSPTNGLRFSEEVFERMVQLKTFSNTNIYKHERLSVYKAYGELVVSSIFNLLKKFYAGTQTLDVIKRHSSTYPDLTEYFKKWLLLYANPPSKEYENPKYKNIKIYNLNEENDYYQAIIDFISGMTDTFAIKIFDEITSF